MSAHLPFDHGMFCNGRIPQDITKLLSIHTELSSGNDYNSHLWCTLNFKRSHMHRNVSEMACAQTSISKMFCGSAPIDPQTCFLRLHTYSWTVHFWNIITASVWHMILYSHIELRKTQDQNDKTYCKYTVSQKNCANIYFAPCLSNINRFQ